jgi:iron complex outermembrane receptor protein
MRHLFRSAAVIALAIAGAAVTNPAAAQTASGSKGGAAADKSTTLDELVVTATKREENLRDIPATISAVTADQLTATGPVVGTQDLLRTIPGIRFNDLQAPNLSEISIRGSGTERATGADSSVGLFVNGAYAGSSTLGGRNFKNIDFFDLERVEALEGPQSALYGRNAEFGVVNVVLAKPKFENSGTVNETYTDKLDQNLLTAVGNYQVNDDVAVRLGAETVGQTKGFYFNPTANQYYDQTSGWIGRGQVRYKHGPLDVTWLVDAEDLDLPAFVSSEQIALGTTLAVPKGFTSDRFNVPSNGMNSTEQRVQRTMLMADWDLGFGTLTSTTMITHSSSLQYFGAAIDTNIEAQFQAQGEPGIYPFTQVHTAAKDRTYYEDLHLAGTAMSGSVEWLTGLELMHQYDSNLVQTQTNPCTLTATSGICTGTPTQPECLKLIPTAANCPVTFPLTFGTVSFTPQRYDSEAVYGSAKYKVGNFSLSGELRYTNDVKKATQNVAALFTGVQTTKPTSFTFSAGKASYGVTASYKLPGDWDDMIYTKVGTGYRAGGVNLGGTPNPLAPTPFQPSYGDETTFSYEAGFKGNLGSNIFVTLDAYASQTQNAITIISDGCSILNACGRAAQSFNANGGTVHGHGVELAINGRWQIVGGRLDVTLNGSNQRATFVSVNGNAPGLPVVGSKVAQIPDWNRSATVNYKHPITSAVDGFFNLTYSGQTGGGQDTVTPTIPFVPLSNYDLLSLRTGFDYKTFEAAVFVKNLTDISYRQLVLQAGGITTAVRWNQPRTIGLNLIYRW